MPEQIHPEKTERQLRRLTTAIESGRLDPVRVMINALNAAEIGHLLESLPSAKRQMVWELVDTDFEGEVLVHVNDDVRIGLIERMETEELVAATESLELDDLADIFDDLPDEVTVKLLDSMDRADQDRLAQVLSYPEDSAGGLMSPVLVSIRSDVSLDVVMRYLRLQKELPEFTDHLFVVSRDGHYLGTLSLSNLLTHEPRMQVADLLDSKLQPFELDTPARDVAMDFEHQDLVSAPVTDQNNVLVGRITIDDVVDVIRDEAEHSVLSMAGLDEEDDLFAPVLQSSARRALWLGINLITALTAAWFIGLFEATLEQVVALAILMPVVASMGGVAGTQTLTLTIRGIALGQVGRGNASSMMFKEVSVGILNGLLWSVVVAIIAGFWFDNAVIGGVIGAAMIINLIAAASAGVVIPLTLKRMQIDPALAGGVVLTTITDVVGFVTFLTLGKLFLV